MEQLPVIVGNDATSVEKSNKIIGTQIEKVTTASQAVREQALSAVGAAEKTNINLQKLIDHHTGLLNDIKSKYDFVGE